jgi:hypothetical protein
VSRFSYIVNDFTGGEISPKWRGRTNLDSYRNSCDIIINGIPTRDGGVMRRGGTEFIQFEDTFADDNSSSNAWNNAATSVGNRDDLASGKGFRMIPFVFSKDEAYVIVLGVKGTATSNNYPCKIINVSDTSQYVSLDNGTPAGIDTLIIGGPPTGSPPVKSPLGIDESKKWGLFTGVENREELAEIQYTQVNDLLFICHPNYPPAIFGRTAENSFRRFFLPELVGTDVTNSTSGSSPVSVEIALGFPFRDIVTSGATMTLNTATRGEGRTLTASSTDGWGGFTSDHVGAYFLMTVSGKTGLVVVTAVGSTTSATVNVLLDVGGTSATTNWRECAWSNARGWPRTVVAHQNRIGFGGNAAQPNTIWWSQTADFSEFNGSKAINDLGATGWTNTSSTAVSSDPFNATILSGQADNINWIVSDKNLTIGTEGREYIADFVIGTSSTTLSVQPQTSFGSAFVQAKKVSNAITFIDRSNISTREFVFNFNEDNFRSEDISFKAKHLPVHSESLEVWTELSSALRNKPKIVEFQIQNTPYAQILWFKDRNGYPFICSRDRELGINGWARMDFSHDVSFSSINKSKASPIETMCSIPSANGTGDDLFIMTKRTLNSSTVFTVERLIGTESFHDSRYPAPEGSLSSLDDPIDYLGLHMDMMFSDTSGSDTLTLSTNLEGETVHAWRSGVYQGEFTVSAAGEITLDSSGFSGELAVAGLKHNFMVQPVVVEAGSVYGNAQGTIKYVEEIVAKLYQTLGLRVGYVRGPEPIYISTGGGTPDDAKVDFDYSDVTLDYLLFNWNELPINLETPFFNGNKKIEFDGDYDDDGRVVFFNDSVYPTYIAALIFKGSTYDR